MALNRESLIPRNPWTVGLRGRLDLLAVSGMRSVRRRSISGKLTLLVLASVGVAVTLDPARVGIPGSAGEFAWGGMASTAFFVDPAEDLIVIFMTQVITDTARRVQLRRDLRTLIYEAMTDRA